MTIHSGHFEFLLKQSTRMLSKADLDLPETPSEFVNLGPRDIVGGDQLAIYTADRSAHCVYTVDRWENGAPGIPRRLAMHDTIFDNRLSLTPFQIDWLEGQGRIKPVHKQPRNQGNVPLPGNAFILTPKQSNHAHRLLQYIDHYRKLIEDENGGKPSDKMLLRAAQEVAARRGEKALRRTALHKAMARLKAKRNADRLLAVAPLPNTGNTKKRIAARVEEVIQEAVKLAYTKNGTYLTVMAAIEELTEPGAEYADVAKQAAGVSRSTIQRRFGGVDKFTREYLHHGSDRALEVSSQRVRVVRPAHVLDTVDVDHTSLDVVVFDDNHPIAFDRPDIITFRDRHCGGVVGFHISFGAPSFTSFIAGLRHTAYPKDPASFPESVTSWPWYGLPKQLGVDHAGHFAGADMESASRELGFRVIEYRPGAGWEKGAMEHLFAILNVGMIQKLPGATERTPEERAKFGEEFGKGKPVLTLRELNGFLTYYFAEIHNRTDHAGIGPLITLKDTPDRLWQTDITNAPMRPLVDPEIFTRLAGYTCEVTIQTDGVRIEHLHYQSHELLALRLHPQHQDGKRRLGGTKYVATRDPNNLGKIWIRDPYRNCMIEVPIIDTEARYANDLTLYQHREILAYHKKQSANAPDVKQLMARRLELEKKLMDLHATRKKHNTAARLARFMSGQAAKIRRSRVIELDQNGEVSGFMNYSDPDVQTPLPKKNLSTTGIMPKRKAKPSAEAVPAPMKESSKSPAKKTEDATSVRGNEIHPVAENYSSDIETLRARFSNWED